MAWRVGRFDGFLPNEVDGLAVFRESILSQGRNCGLEK